MGRWLRALMGIEAATVEFPTMNCGYWLLNLTSTSSTAGCKRPHRNVVVMGGNVSEHIPLHLRTGLPRGLPQLGTNGTVPSQLSSTTGPVRRLKPAASTSRRGVSDRSVGSRTAKVPGRFSPVRSSRQRAASKVDRKPSAVKRKGNRAMVKRNRAPKAQKRTP